MQGVNIARATTADAAEILALQRLAYQSEAELYGDWSIPPLTQTLSSLEAEFADTVFLKAEIHGRLVGSVRAKISAGRCAIGRLIVHPDFQRQGIGGRLLQEIEAAFSQAVTYELFTGSKSAANLRLYEKHGYAVSRTQALSPLVKLVYLEKRSRDSTR